MQLQWLKRRPNAPLVIVVFGGWALGAGVFAHLETTADILFVSDYRDLACDLPTLDHYETRVLVAWSFGIASYCAWQKGRVDIFDRKIALNGSMTPVDRRVGIPPVIMQKTIDTLSDAAFQVFLTRSYGKKQPHETIDVPARKAELIAVNSRDYRGGELHWDKVCISRHDKIFPFNNMQRAWQVPLDVLGGPHVPFAAWETWDEVIA
ncbi:MAG: pimeloyl-ACP methyl esterase BioG family protein [Paracoccaceae bacterium]